MEHAVPSLTIGIPASHPRFLELIDPPTFPFTSPSWILPQKPRSISLLEVYKSHELLTTVCSDLSILH